MTGAPGWPDGDPLDLVLPIHNEAEGIATSIREWFDEADRLGIALRILACEDGSTDGTRAVLERLASERPIVLVGGGERKGYARAVVGGLRLTSAPWVCCADGDGQCDPADLGSLLAARRDEVVVVGVRRPRRDPLVRRLMSLSMRGAFVALHRIHLRDPSSPYCVVPGVVAHRVARPEPLLAQGYWWEFHIRRDRLGIGTVEVPVHHRARTAGTTQVYLPRRLPTIVGTHLRGLWRLRKEEAHRW